MTDNVYETFLFVNPRVLPGLLRENSDASHRLANPRQQLPNRVCAGFELVQVFPLRASLLAIQLGGTWDDEYTECWKMTGQVAPRAPDRVRREGSHSGEYGREVKLLYFS